MIPVQRTRLSELDRELVAILAQRFRVVAEAWSEKRREGIPLRDLRQEAAVRCRAQLWGGEEGIPPAAVDRILRVVLEEGRRYAGRALAAETPLPTPRALGARPAGRVAETLRSLGP